MRGQDCKTYYNSTSSNYSSPTWNEVGRVVNDTITDTSEDITGANRSSRWKSEDNGTMQLEGELTIEYADTDGGAEADYIAFRVAKHANSVLDMLFLDGAYATGSGYRAPMKVKSVELNRDLDSKVEISVSLKSTTWDDSGTLREPTGWSAGADDALDS